EDALGGDVVICDQVRDARGQDAGLARARAGEHEQWTCGMLDGFALRGIERKRGQTCHDSGNSNTNTAPLPSGPGRNVTRPPCCCSTIRRASASPIPQPPLLLVVPGSNSCRSISGATPGPSSRTLTRPFPSAASTSTSMRPPRPLNASTAFLTITSSAHSISTGSPMAVGPDPGEESDIVTECASVGRRGRK